MIQKRVVMFRSMQTNTASHHLSGITGSLLGINTSSYTQHVCRNLALAMRFMHSMTFISITNVSISLFWLQNQSPRNRDCEIPVLQQTNHMLFSC
uniref:Uncharacterized protein n=1 Tax=Arundo donax TaxID=35708 RepID=A0A0A9G1Q9_ARUDO